MGLDTGRFVKSRVLEKSLRIATTDLEAVRVNNLREAAVTLTPSLNKIGALAEPSSLSVYRMSVIADGQRCRGLG
jgi:hypothetical protein